MLKYTTAQVVFSEIPDEITLAINLSNCPIHCPNCHSKELWENIGTELTEDTLKSLIDDNKGISCVCFMGGDSDLLTLYDLIDFVADNYDIHIAWYSGRDKIPIGVPLSLDYIKIGPYKEECGPLNNPNTNQVFYTRGRLMNKMSVSFNSFYDTTDKFWSKYE